MFKETEKKLFVIVKNDEKWRPKFYANGKWYSLVSGIVKWVSTEVKDIVSTKGDNVGKTITIYNLIIDMVSTDGEYELQLPLYSGLARTAMNALAWWYNGDEAFFSVYNNKKGFRGMSIRNSQDKEDYITPFYTWEEELGMVETKKVKWELKKDYDALSDRYVEELLPKIIEKLGTGIEIEKWENVPQSDDENIPF
jgi:hypothetical protein